MFWRLHWSNCPTFSADNAESVGWAERAVGFCCVCDGSGLVSDYNKDGDLVQRTCGRCTGSGEPLRLKGYSCFDSLSKLQDYFRNRGLVNAEDGVVIAFDGIYEGLGEDGEDLVTPTKVYKVISVKEAKLA